MDYQYFKPLCRFLFLSSFCSFAYAVSVGTQTSDSSDCTAAGLNFILLSNVDGFLYQCTAADNPAGREIIRSYNSIVFEHILFAAPDLWGMEKDQLDSQNIMAASSDNSALSLWSTTNISQITEESGNVNVSDFDIDIYQFIGGFDKALGNLFFGSSLNYAHTEIEVVNIATSTSDSIGFTPYVAYKFNDFIFVSGLASYLYTHTNRVNGDSDLDKHDYIAESHINAFKMIDSFILKGRMGLRYVHTITSPEIGNANLDNSFDELTWVGDGEVGYRFNNKLRIYTGLLYEYYDREASSTSSRVRDSIAFMRYGAEYSVSNDLILGAKLQHDINDEDNDYIIGSFNIRLAF